MEELKNNKIFWAIVVMTVIIFGYVVVGKVALNKIADKVIEKLQKEYSPSPYGPGVDPDKIDPRSLQRQLFEMHQVQSSETANNFVNAETWRTTWENDRGTE